MIGVVFNDAKEMDKFFRVDTLCGPGYPYRTIYLTDAAPLYVGSIWLAKFLRQGPRRSLWPIALPQAL
jgi:hypothetical protein